MAIPRMNAQSMSQNVACYPPKSRVAQLCSALKAFQKKLIAPSEVLGEDYRQTAPVELGNLDSTLDSLLTLERPRTNRKWRRNDLNCKFEEFIGGSGT